MALGGYSKREKKQLRELAAKAYRTELNTALQDLFEQFQQWQVDKLDPFELSDKIHAFHQGISRELYNRYDDRWADMTVARALVEGILNETDVPESLLEKLGTRRAFFEDA